MEGNRSILVEELQLGDEVIVTGLRYFKILRKPILRTTPNTWGSLRYKSIKRLKTK